MRRPEARPGGDAGVMLIELLVGILLVGVVGGLTSTAIVSALRSQVYVTTRATDLDSLRQVLQRMTRDLRQASAVVTPPTPSSLVVSVPTATGTRTLSYYVSGQSLMESITDSGVSGPARTLLLLANYDAAAPLPLFSYASAVGYTSSGGVDPTFCTSASLPGAFDPGCVGQVTIHLSALVNKHPDVSIADTVELRNTGQQS